ncbi:MAG: FHA domain-containing protein [Chloroflexi bacterium]|nr:FHA domain-containing protein [Chloroflexota bacterium]
MQLCPHCGTENREGVLFCQQCGIALGPVSLSTRQLEENGSPRMGSDNLGDENVLLLQINDDESPIVVQIRDEVILGRITEQADRITYVNLSVYGADQSGVSRRHARLLRENKAVYLMDLDSTNGTYLNGEVLQNGVEKRLRDGDEVKLGDLKIFVYFKP